MVATTIIFRKVAGATTLDTTEAIISDLQQNIKINNGGKASRILNAKLKATKSASKSRKNKVQAPKSRSSKESSVNTDQNRNQHSVV